MKQYIACDAHKRYSLFGGISEDGGRLRVVRVSHEQKTYRAFLDMLPEGSTIALETIGSWYWMVDEMEDAGHRPLLTHARKAKLMMGQIDKTDRLDVTGLGILSRNGTLPTVWIPPKEVRDLRELPRLRMMLVPIRTGLKNRIHATLAKYNLVVEGVSDMFGVRGRQRMGECLKKLPPETRRAAEEQLKLLDDVEERVKETEKRIAQLIQETPDMQLMKTLPGFGKILAVVAVLEIGVISRFGGPSYLASYSGTVPRVCSSGDKMRLGRIRPDVNRYLRWAFVEAANVIALNRHRMPNRHVTRLYERICARRGHGKAIIAVSRHLAEASYWVLTKKEPYREPCVRTKGVSSTQD